MSTNQKQLLRLKMRLQTDKSLEHSRPDIILREKTNPSVKIIEQNNVDK